MGYNKKAVWRDISVRFLPETPEMKQTARGEEWDEPEGCGEESYRAGNFRGLCPKIGRRSSCPSNEKTIEHARQRVHDPSKGYEFNRRKEHGKPEDPYQAQGL